MIKCLAVDDEELSLNLLEDNIKRVPFLHLVKTCRNAFEAMDVMRQEQIDLLFLDIQMPGLTGLQLVQAMQTKPLVIFITAYRKYALEGFELDVLDYLVKPVAYERFLKAVNKAADYYALKNPPVTTEPLQPDYLFVNVGYNLVKINIRDITFIEGVKDYIKINFQSGEKPVLTRLSLKTIADRLAAPAFVRVHKSFIVAIDKITSIRKDRIYIQEQVVAISDFYKEDLYRYIQPHIPK